MSLLRLLDLGVEQAEQRGVSVHGRAELQIAIGPLSFSSHPGRRGRQWNKFHPSPSSRYFTSNHSGRSICHPQASLAPVVSLDILWHCKDTARWGAMVWKWFVSQWFMCWELDPKCGQVVGLQRQGLAKGLLLVFGAWLKMLCFLISYMPHLPPLQALLIMASTMRAWTELTGPNSKASGTIN